MFLAQSLHDLCKSLHIATTLKYVSAGEERINSQTSLVHQVPEE
jgi:hypothetical protein